MFAIIYGISVATLFFCLFVFLLGDERCTLEHVKLKIKKE